MQVFFESFWLPKAGNSEDEYEDAFSTPVEPDSGANSHFRYAVADGATETSFSGSWANALCLHYANLPLGDEGLEGFLNEFAAVQQQWQREIEGRSLSWFAEEKARSGAFAALIGLTLSESSPESTVDAGDGSDQDPNQGSNSEAQLSLMRFTALAVGDSCLFWVRSDSLVKSFPLNTAKDFNNSPYLLSSRQPPDDILKRNIHVMADECSFGDVFYLMTDALAAWVLSSRENENDDSVFVSLRNITTQEEFAQLIQEERRGRDELGRVRMRNDDVTLVRLRIDAAPLLAGEI